MGGKKKQQQQQGKARRRRPGRRKGGRGNTIAGTASKVGSVISGVGQVARSLAQELGPLLATLAFPTSGASAMASPNLALGGYNSSMALSAPAANGTYVKHTKARMRSSKTGMSVRHREYVQDITFGDSGTFNNMVALPINPGNRQLFPWLSGIATRFETYRFNSLRFIYEPQCGTGKEGTVMVAVDFDAVDPPPVDKLQFMTYDGAVRSPPWFASVYECAGYNIHKYKEYYITRSLTTPTSTDEKTYFVGNIFVATQSESSPFTAGEFYVEYDIVLSTPQLDSISGDQSWFQQWNQPLAGPPPATTTYSGGSLDVIIDDSAGLDGVYDVIVVDPGIYLVTVNFTNAGENPTVTITTAGPPSGFTLTSILAYPGASNVNYGICMAVVVNLSGPLWFQINYNGDVGDAAAASDLYIAPLDQQTLAVVGPLTVPPTSVLLSRMDRFKKLQSSHHSGGSEAAKLLDRVVSVEERIYAMLADKKLSLTLPTSNMEHPAQTSSEPDSASAFMQIMSQNREMFGGQNAARRAVVEKPVRMSEGKPKPC